MQQTPTTHPYERLPDPAFWSRAVGAVPLFALDPMAGTAIRPDQKVARETRIATAGSCFAQHIAARLQASGYRYFVTEDAPEGLSAAEAKARGYRLFSARYGNVYTARQLRQLLERAYGRFRPADGAWQRPDGRWVDPFRPRIEPGGYAAPEAVEAARQAHFACVRKLFEELDVFVFTLGLTESWRAAEDGAVFPLSPGAAGGAFDADRYRFVNASLEESVEDLAAFLDDVKKVNPRCRFILTVSPVPLVATYEKRHVLQSTALSKAVLRVAAQKLADARDDVLYFPSYEIITSPEGAFRYLESDLRSVTPEGVDHVMRVFFRHLTEDGEPDAAPRSAMPLHGSGREFREQADIVCDEEALDPAGAARETESGAVGARSNDNLSSGQASWDAASSSSAPIARSTSWRGAYRFCRRVLRLS